MYFSMARAEIAMKNILVILMIVNFLFYSSEAATLQNVTNLRRHLFNTNLYDKLSRPMNNQSVPTPVRIGLSISAIYSLDEVEQVLKTAGHLNVEWLDEALMWNPEDFGGLTSAMYPQGNVWLPDLSLMNSVQDYQVFGHSTLTILVSNNGTVQWQPYQVFTTTCQVVTTYFPFDTQTCALTFVTWSYSNSGILFDFPRFSPAVDLSNFQNNSAWELLSTYHKTDMGEKPSITFVLTLERKPAQIVASIILPLIILSLLNVCVFVLPCESGEKASYSITVFLAFVVFATLVKGTLPESAETSKSYLAVYINIQTVQSAVIAIIGIICIRIHNLTRPVPIWLQNSFFARKTKNTSAVTALKPRNAFITESYPHSEQCFVEATDKQHESERETKVSSNTDCNPTVSEKQNVCSTAEVPSMRCRWKDVIDKVDLLLFTLFLIAELLVTTVFFTVTNTSENA